MTCDRKIGPYPCCSVVQGDCLELMKALPDGCVDAVYIDPPFNSGANHKSTIGSFSDRYDSMDSYIKYMRLRCIEMIRGLSASGSFYLHCDWHASHYLRVMLDQVFGSARFLNELIWCYSIGGKSAICFGRKHDTLLLYAKGTSHTFNLDGAKVRRKPDSHMRSGVSGDGRQYQEKTDRKTGKVYRYYMDEGKIAEDWWTDIETLNRSDCERVSWPTQKPIALMDRIIKTSTRLGDLVLDGFCGSGTTLVSAKALGRHYLGFDVSGAACAIASRRLAEIDARPGLFETNEPASFGGAE